MRAWRKAVICETVELKRLCVGKTRACSLLQAAAHRCKDVEVPNLVAVAVSTVAIAMPTAAIAMSAVDDEASLWLPPPIAPSAATWHVYRAVLPHHCSFRPD